MKTQRFKVKTQRFKGPMGKYIEQHLALRNSLGFIYKTVKCTLDAFDGHLASCFPHCQTVTREMVISYLDSIRHNQPTTRSQHISTIRQFCRFMLQFDPTTYIPEKDLIGPAKVQIKPHIFTEEEIITLIKQAKKIVWGKHIHYYPIPM